MASVAQLLSRFLYIYFSAARVNRETAAQIYDNSHALNHTPQKYSYPVSLSVT
jgi:hypothetical protein